MTPEVDRHAINVSHNIMVPMRDGVRLATVVIRPEGSAHPALLSALPTPLRPWTPSAADAGLFRRRSRIGLAAYMAAEVLAGRPMPHPAAGPLAWVVTGEQAGHAGGTLAHPPGRTCQPPLSLL